MKIVEKRIIATPNEYRFEKSLVSCLGSESVEKYEVAIRRNHLLDSFCATFLLCDTDCYILLETWGGLGVSSLSSGFAVDRAEEKDMVLSDIVDKIIEELK